MKVPGSKIVPCQGVRGSNHSLTFGLFTQASGSGPLGPLVIFASFISGLFRMNQVTLTSFHDPVEFSYIVSEGYK